MLNSTKKKIVWWQIAWTLLLLLEDEEEKHKQQFNFITFQQFYMHFLLKFAFFLLIFHSSSIVCSEIGWVSAFFHFAVVAVFILVSRRIPDE